MRVGSGKDMGGGSFVQFVFIRRPGPASERPFTARNRGRARAGVGAGAVRAPDCPRARRMQDALRLSAESGSFRMRAGADGTRSMDAASLGPIIAHFLRMQAL